MEERKLTRTLLTITLTLGLEHSCKLPQKFLLYLAHSLAMSYTLFSIPLRHLYRGRLLSYMIEIDMNIRSTMSGVSF